MNTLERKYSKSERIIAKAKFSGTVYLRSILLAALLGGVIAAVWVFKDSIEHAFTKGEGAAVYLTDDVMRWALLGAGIAVLISFFAHGLSLYSKELIVTEDKVVFRTGVLAVTNTTIPISEIVIIETNQNFFQRIFNVGTVSIVSDAERPYKIKGVKSADRLTRRIMKQVADVKKESERKKMQLQLSGFVPKSR